MSSPSFEEIKTLFSTLVSIDAPSGGEEEMGRYLIKLYGKLGISLEQDPEGNLYGFIPGTGESILLSAHQDTVEPSRGKTAVFEEDGTVVYGNGSSVLGADDASGLLEIYLAVKKLLASGAPHRSIELLFSTREEKFCEGASAFDFRKIKSGTAYVLDLSGPIGHAAFAAPTIISFDATIPGRAAHAGFEPEAGIHAIKAAAYGITALPQGRIDDELTGNIGLIQGGCGVNIIPETARLSGEIRSLKHEKALHLAKQYRSILENAAKSEGASLSWEERVHIQAYETHREAEVATAYEKACKSLGIVPVLQKTFGGSDANVFSQHGIESIVIANSMYKIHSTEEYTDLREIAQVVDILLALLTL